MAVSEAPSSAGAVTGVVVIGRNEGDRLLACLRALRGQARARPVVYVDSGSRDGSPERARPLCDAVLALDPARPFSAARARNEGAALLHARWPGLRRLQFLDGDCVVADGWLAAAEAALDADPGCAVVVGQLVERRPEASAYNRLCALEWQSPAGRLRHPGQIGGLMMVRLPVFLALGGFRPEVIAGEDSEFGVRVALAGHGLRKLDRPMATHDADMHRFGQWWTRAVRAGHAIGQRAHLHGRSVVRDCVRERASTWLWGLALPLAALGLAGPSRGASLALLGAYALLGWRIFRRRRAQGESPADAWLYTRFNLLAKFANAWGLLKFQANLLRGRYRIIEYK